LKVVVPSEDVRRESTIVERISGWNNADETGASSRRRERSTGRGSLDWGSWDRGRVNKVKIDTIECGVKEEKISVALDDEFGEAVSKAMFESTNKMCFGTNVAKSAILGTPGEGHVVDQGGNASGGCGVGTGVNQKILSAAANNADRVESKFVLVFSHVESQDVNIAARESMEIGLQELDNNGVDGGELAHRW
jgi:hypothetical protein